MTKFSQGVSYSRFRILFITISIMICSACDGNDSALQKKRGPSGVEGIESCISNGVSKDEAIHLLNQCGIRGEIAPQPLGEYRPDIDASKKDFEKADSIRIQGRYHQEHGGHAIISVNFNETGILDIEVNAAAEEDELLKPFAEVKSVDELRNTIDELLSKSADHKAFLNDREWHGMNIGTISERDTRYLLDFETWLIITESDEGSSTCILSFEESKLSSVNCKESKL